jgi:ferredoxin
VIVAEQKSLEEISRLIGPYSRVLVVGCGTCMTVCSAGGEREVAFLHDALRLAQVKTGNGETVFTETVLKRQCDPEFIAALDAQVNEVDAILSLGCGIGVQTIAERYPDTPVLPGVNTSFIGAAQEWGVWDERCAACGECRLAETGGICPITRCTKAILNGPCAGTKNGKCEANKEMDCAWILIYQRLERLQQLEKMRRYYPPRNYLAVPRPKRLVSKVPVAAGDDHA